MKFEQTYQELAEFVDFCADRCLGCKNPSCVKGCPLGNDIPQMLSLAKQGKYMEASAVIDHPFGEICGYVCPSHLQCCKGCVRGSTAYSIDIHLAESYLKKMYPYTIKQKTTLLAGKTVAVVGGGVSGLTFAAKMMEQGASVTIFEKDKLLSTLYLIPTYRFDHSAIDRVTKAFDGVQVCKQTVDANMLSSLVEKYNYVYLSAGLVKHRPLGVPGEQYAVDFADVLKGLPVGNNTVVIGGGNTAIDCARYICRNEQYATVAYRRSLAEMPAFQMDIGYAVMEGVQFDCNLSPVSVTPNANGTFAVVFEETKSVNRGPLTFTGKKWTCNYDTVVCAVGATFDSAILQGGKVQGNQVVSASGNVIPNLYVGGDCAGGSLVVDAVKHALDVAKQIIKQVTL